MFKLKCVPSFGNESKTLEERVKVGKEHSRTDSDEETLGYIIITIIIIGLLKWREK